MTVALPGRVARFERFRKGANSSDTSKAWPLATVFLVLTPVPYVTLTCVPVWASSPEATFRLSLIGSGDRRVISLWARAVDEMLSARAPRLLRSRYFQGSSSNLAVIRSARDGVVRLRFGFPDRRVPDCVVKMASSDGEQISSKNRHFRTHKGELVAHPGRGIRLRIGESQCPAPRSQR